MTADFGCDDSAEKVSCEVELHGNHVLVMTRLDYSQRCPDPDTGPQTTTCSSEIATCEGPSLPTGFYTLVYASCERPIDEDRPHKPVVDVEGAPA